jgi:hypothetical protein
MRLSEAARVAIARWKTTLGDFRLKSLHCKSFGRQRTVFISRYMTGINFTIAPSNTSPNQFESDFCMRSTQYYFYENHQPMFTIFTIEI